MRVFTIFTVSLACLEYAAVEVEAQDGSYDDQNVWIETCSLNLLDDGNNDDVANQEELAQFLTSECQAVTPECQPFNFENLPLFVQIHFAYATCLNNVTDVVGGIIDHSNGGDDLPENPVSDPGYYTASICYDSANTTNPNPDTFGIVLKKGATVILEEFCMKIFHPLVQYEIIEVHGELSPSAFPTSQPSLDPSPSPSASPTGVPTIAPSSHFPTASPTLEWPSDSPTRSEHPSNFPSTTSRPSVTLVPSYEPSRSPTRHPTATPTELPTSSNEPSNRSTPRPTKRKKNQTTAPSIIPTSVPSFAPTTLEPSPGPSGRPSSTPSAKPSAVPSFEPTTEPTRTPSVNPTPRADLALDVSFHYLMLFRQYIAAAAVEDGPLDTKLEVTFNTIIEDGIESNDAIVRYDVHLHHSDPNNVSRLLRKKLERKLQEEQLNILLLSLSNDDFVDVECPENVEITDNQETCVVVTTTATIAGNELIIAREIILDIVKDSMEPPETSEFLMLYNDDRVKTVTYVGDGSFSESESEDIIVLAEPRPIVFEEEEDDDFSDSEIIVIALASALTASLFIVMGALYRQKRNASKDLVDANAQDEEKALTTHEGGLYNDALSAIDEKSLEGYMVIDGDDNIKENLPLTAQQTASLSKSYSNEEKIEDAILSDDWRKVSELAMKITGDNEISSRPPSPLSQVYSESTNSSFSGEERRMVDKLAELADRDDWDAVASLASNISIRSQEKSLSRRAGGSVSSKGSLSSKLSNIDAPPLIGLAVKSDPNDDDVHSATSSLSGESRKSVGSRGSRISEKSLRAQVLSLLQRGAPEELPNADKMIKMFEDRPDDLIEMLEEKVKQKEDFRKQVISLLEQSAPEEVENADAMIEAFANAEDDLLDVLQSMHERKIAEKQRLAKQGLAKIDAKEVASQKRTPKIVGSIETGKSLEKDSRRSTGDAEISEAITTGDWAVVAARAAVLADEDDSTNYASSSLTTSSEEGDSELDRLDDMIEREDWDALIRSTQK